MLHIYSLHKQERSKAKRRTMKSAKSASIEERVSALEKAVDGMRSAEEKPDDTAKPDDPEKPKKNYVSGWLLFRRDRGPQAKKMLEKLRMVASGPNLVRVMSAMWAEIGDEERAKWNEKAKVARTVV
jgi:hypothetical protein